MMDQPSMVLGSASVIERVVVRLEARLGRHVGDFQVRICKEGLVLRGHAHTFYAKQMAQHVAQEVSGLPICGNEIEVS